MSRRQNSIRRAKRQRQKARARRNHLERVEQAILDMDKPEKANSTVSTAATITISGPPVGSHPPGIILSDWFQIPHPT